MIGSTDEVYTVSVSQGTLESYNSFGDPLTFDDLAAGPSVPCPTKPSFPARPSSPATPRPRTPVGFLDDPGIGAGAVADKVGFIDDGIAGLGPVVHL